MGPWAVAHQLGPKLRCIAKFQAPPCKAVAQVVGLAFSKSLKEPRRLGSELGIAVGGDVLQRWQDLVAQVPGRCPLRVERPHKPRPGFGGLIHPHRGKVRQVAGVNLVGPQAIGRQHPKQPPPSWVSNGAPPLGNLFIGGQRSRIDRSRRIAPLEMDQPCRWQPRKLCELAIGIVGP